MLRDYQQEMKDRLYEAWTRYQSVMVQMPTGTGKTHLMAAVIQENMDHGVLIVAHRVELIGQISETLRTFGVPHGIIDRMTKDTDEVMARHKVVVASIQTLSRRIGGGVHGAVIIDEAHHAVAKTYRQLWDKWPDAKFLGLTATPCRLNQTGFTDLFDTLLESYSIQEFIDKGWLSDFEYISVMPDNWMVSRIAGLKKRGVDGDYQTKEMATVMDSRESIEHLYDTYEKYAKGKKGIVYAINREHAQHISDYYVSKGVKCCWIDALTPAEERERLVRLYRGESRGQAPDPDLRTDQGASPHDSLDVIVNVDIFSEGFDCPEVEFIQLARPTLSLSKYLQQVGRGMRMIPGKDYVIILDQVGMYQTFGMPTEEREWKLMFEGKMKGKGRHGGDRYIIRDEPDLTLINLDMVRIKRHGEKNIGVEIFIQGGKFGVVRDGMVTCAPEFEHIRRVRGGQFFAIATYPYAVFRNRTTVISLGGIDQRVALYGKVAVDGDVVEGETIQGKRTYWDGVGQTYYDSRPEFETVGGVQMVTRNGAYQLRKKSPYLREPVSKEDIWYNRYILWMRDVIVLKATGQVFPVKAFGTECFYVANTDRSREGRYMRMELNGMISSQIIDQLNRNFATELPDKSTGQLIRASSGQMEYLDQEYQRQKSNVTIFHEI